MIADHMDRGAVDELISRLARFDHARTGVCEEYLPEPVGANGLAILTRPLGAAATAGFVICRSPGPEQGPMQRLEALIARVLGEEGYPSIRIRRGLALEGVGSELDLAESLAETEDAVSALVAATGVKHVGVVGELLGATVALSAAVRLELPFAVLLSPVTNGSRYLDQLFRRNLITAFMKPSERAAAREPLEQQLARGPVAIRGVRLTREGFDAVAAVDLRGEVARFGGAALVVAVTRTGEPDEDVRALEKAFASATRPVTVRVLSDPLPVPFGELHLRKSRSRQTRDIRLDLDQQLARLTVDWASSRLGEGG